VLPGLPHRRLTGPIAVSLESDESQAARRRLVLSADAEHRRIERELHEGVQQQLVALAVNLQHARKLADTDLVRAKTLLDEMGRDLQQALDELRQLAQRVYPPLLESGGLAAALRSAAASAKVSAVVEVDARGSLPPGIALTIYGCWLEALEQAEGDMAISVRESSGEVAFEVQPVHPVLDFGNAIDRVEALGGRLDLRETRLSGVLPC
jgi:signal transduction histidine kinase